MGLHIGKGVQIGSGELDMIYPRREVGDGVVAVSWRERK